MEPGPEGSCYTNDFLQTNMEGYWLSERKIPGSKFLLVPETELKEKYLMLD